MNNFFCSLRVMTISSCSLALITLSSVSGAETININRLEEVKVIGQKVERNRQGTVQSVSIFDENALKTLGQSEDFYELLSQAANIASSGSFDFSIRGIAGNGPTNVNNGASTIGFFIDGINQNARGTQAGAVSLWDLQQVEVLRGAQSTITGRNALAGAFVLKSRDPEFNSSGKAQLAYGDFNTYQVALAQTGGLTEHLAYRISVDRTGSNNFINNPNIDGDEYDRDNTTTSRAKLLYQYADEGRVLLTLNDIRFRDYGDDTVQGNPEVRRSNWNTPSTWFTNTQSVAVDITHALSNHWDFVSLSTFADTEFDRDSDPDGALGESVLVQDTLEDNATQEFLLRYSSNRIKGVTGIFLSTGERADSFSTQGALIDLDGPGPIPGVLLNFGSASRESFDNAALFFSTDYQFADRWTLLSGLRIDYEKRSNDIQSNGERLTSTGDPMIDALLDAQISGSDAPATGSDSATNILPKLGLDYRWNDHLNIGALVQRGYRPGGVSVNITRSLARAYDAEFTTNYELSVRAHWFDERLSINTTLFHTDWRDQQVSVEGPFGNFDEFIVNAARSTIQGMEIESRYENEHWSFYASLGIAETEFDDFTVDTQVLFGEGSIALSQFSGNEFAFSRDRTFSTGVRYDWSQGWWVNLGFNYANDGFANALNTLKIDEYRLVNAKFGYDATHWSMFAYVTNATDETHVTERYIGPNGVDIDAVVAAPRVVGATLSLNW